MKKKGISLFVCHTQGFTGDGETSFVRKRHAR